MEIQGSHFIGNKNGLIWEASTDINGNQIGTFVLEDSELIGNKVGLFAASGAEVRNNLIQANSTGVVVLRGNPAAPLYLEGNRIVNNRQWGVAIYTLPCAPEGWPPPDRKVSLLGRIEGQGNEIHDNGLGDLCPSDYNWPAGFITQTESSKAGGH